MEETPPPLAVALRTLSIRGLLVAVPALKAMREALPVHRLVVAAPGWLDPLISLIPGVDGHIHQQTAQHFLPLIPGEVDIAANLHDAGSASAILHALEPRVVIEHGPRVCWRDDLHERERWVRLMTSFGIPGDPDDVGLLPAPASPLESSTAVVHVGAPQTSSQWPVERFAKVAAALAPPVVISGAAEDHDRAQEVARRAGLPSDSVVTGCRLSEFLVLIASARLLVSVDSDASHLATAYRTPSVVLFGPTPSDRWGPVVSGPHLAVDRPAVRLGDVTAPRPDPALMAISAEEVLEAISDLHAAVPSLPT
jgi:ADP-heptose:LPS heptosyltransferase